MEVKKIILVFKTHFDIGFTNLASKVIEDYAGRMLQEVITTCRGTENMGKLKFVWTMPSWPLWHIVNNCTPELKKELDELVEAGQVVWHALPFTTHTDFCTPGEYIEGLKYSRMLAEYYHRPAPIAAKMTDVPGHSIMLPDILSEAGVRFLHLGCNEFATPPEVPDLFFWKAPSGRKVLTMYSRGGYGSGLVPPKNWKYPVWMALMHTQDNSGPQSAGAITRMVEKIREVYPNAEVVCGTMDDFCREMEKCDLSDVPVIDKDLADTWIHGVGAYPKESAVLRENRRKAVALESVYAKKLLDGAENTGALWDSYYEDVTLFEEHTWGADVKTYLGPNRVYEKEDFLEAKDSEAYRFMETSWEEQKDRVRRSSESLQKLEALLLAPEGYGNGFQLFYSGSGTYTGWVKLPEELKNKHLKVGKNSLPCAQIGADWCCYVENLPAFQRTDIEIEEDREASVNGLRVETVSEGTSVENHRYRLVFSPEDGRILRLYDKELGEELLRANEEESVFSYRYDRYGYDDINEYLRKYGYHFTTWGVQDYGRENYPFCEHETFLPSFESYQIDGDKVTFTYTAEKSVKKYGDAKKITIEVTLPECGDEIFVELHLNGKQESPFVEAGSFVLPFAADRADYRMKKGGVILDPREEIQEKANHSLYCLEDGIAVLGEKVGVSVKTMDAPLAALGDPGVYRYSPVFTEPEHPTVYFNLFNNMWGTNFPQWMGGDFSFRFSLSGITRKDADKLAVMWEDSLDSVAVLSDAEGAETTDLTLPENMKLIGVKALDQGIVLTFLDLMGEKSERTLRVGGFCLTPCGLFGEPQGEDKAEEYTFEAQPFGQQSFYLERQ